MNTINDSLKASKNPLQAIKAVTYDGQDEKRRMYHEGYEASMDAMPLLDAKDDLLQDKLALSQGIMKSLANELINDKWATEENIPDGEFQRTIIAIEEPVVETTDNGLAVKEGKEFIVAKWGNGFSSPVHGHAAGFLHEELLSGKVRVNTYRMLAPDSNVVRLIASEIYKGGVTIASTFAVPPADAKFKRQSFIHNFTSIGNSSSLHYVPEHTRDGRDNSFEVEFFEDTFGLSGADVKQITSLEGMYLRNGEVCLVRSTNVTDYGDHYIVITGRPVVKEHGLRPQEVAIIAPHTSGLLDEFPLKTGLTLLKLNDKSKKAFHEFHGISIINGEVAFQKA